MIRVCGQHYIFCVKYHSHRLLPKNCPYGVLSKPNFPW